MCQDLAGLKPRAGKLFLLVRFTNPGSNQTGGEIATKDSFLSLNIFLIHVPYKAQLVAESLKPDKLKFQVKHIFSSKGEINKSLEKTPRSREVSMA